MRIFVESKPQPSLAWNPSDGPNSHARYATRLAVRIFGNTRGYVTVCMVPGFDIISCN